ncbi:MAG: multicopper oxidase domain-containing protein, partial [Brevinema sp.]
MTSKKAILFISILNIGLIFFNSSMWSQGRMRNRRAIPSFNTVNVLPIPPLMEVQQNGNTKTFNVEAKHTTHDFLGTGQTTEVLGYNGASYLGPTIKVAKGNRMILNVKNSLKNVPTTLHRHGAVLDAKDDGNQNQSIPAG